ncbi:MAG TPA: hypothetical protein VG148_12130, partial [Pyrinomonadaceae bacterium]|nr:hypothetical protein [Pyrinomonadaceae bacterium]
MSEKKSDSEDDKFSIETSFEISYAEEANEIEFVIYHDEKPALTVKGNLETVLAVIRRCLFESSMGEFILENYDSDPDKGGQLLSERVVKSREVL